MRLEILRKELLETNLELLRTGEYKHSTDLAISRKTTAVPSALVANHRPFCWEPSAARTSQNAFIPESVARVAYSTRNLNPAAEPSRVRRITGNTCANMGRRLINSQAKGKQ
jgi:ribulose-5-phosphate 4-epimerase/fuculose-1-phosphate aldolase